MPIAYSEARVNANVRATKGHNGLAGGAKRSQPIMASVMAEGAVPKMPPSDIPMRMAEIGAGEVM
jgi:hypothetical protein